MPEPADELHDDWIHGVFAVLREEVISISADFGHRVKREIDDVADLQGVRPPSATALLTSVAIETTNIAGSLLGAADDADDEPGDGEDSRREPGDTPQGDDSKDTKE